MDRCIIREDRILVGHIGRARPGMISKIGGFVCGSKTSRVVRSNQYLGESASAQLKTPEFLDFETLATPWQFFFTTFLSIFNFQRSKTQQQRVQIVQKLSRAV